MNEEATVFLVDDDPATLRAIAAAVKVVFPCVEAYSSAETFLAAYRADRPGCLVLDVAMPGMSGLELQRKLIHDKIALPVIFVTAHANVPMAVEAMQLGAVNFLEKPVPEHRALGQHPQGDRAGRAGPPPPRPRQRAEDRLARLTPGERAVLDLILEGKMNKEIAAELGLSTRTIEDRRAKLMKKMDAGCLAELMQLVMTR